MFAVFGSIFAEIQLPAAFLTKLNEKITLVFEMLTVLKTAYKCSGLRLRLHQSKRMRNVSVPVSFCRLHTKRESGIKTFRFRHESGNF